MEEKMQIIKSENSTVILKFSNRSEEDKQKVYEEIAQAIYNLALHEYQKSYKKDN